MKKTAEAYKAGRRDTLLWISFICAALIAFFGIMAIDSRSLLPAALTAGALIYISLFMAANYQEETEE